MAIGVRELGDPLLEGRDYKGPAGLRGLEAFARLLIQSEQGDADRQFTRALVDSAGIWLHLPGVATWRIIDGYSWADHHDGNHLRAMLFGHEAKKH